MCLMDNESISKNILKIRTEKDLTQQEMADWLEISRSAYCKIEYGKTRLINDNLVKIAELAGVSPEEVLLGYVPVEDKTGALKDTRDRYTSQIKALKTDYEARLDKLQTENILLKQIIDDKERSIRNLQSMVDFLSKSKEK